jgi:hypothetical protein
MMMPMSKPRVARGVRSFVPVAVLALMTPGTAQAQEPAAWGGQLNFATFFIAAIDPRTGETGVAVTTRVPFLGNGVP